MLSPAPSIDDFYAIFQSHLLGEGLGLPRDSLLVKALVNGVSIRLLNDFLTYIEVREDGSVALMALQPTYVGLLMAFYWWCHSHMQGNCMPPTLTGYVLPGLTFSASWRIIIITQGF